MIAVEEKAKILETLSLTHSITEVVEFFFQELKKIDSFEGANLYFEKTGEILKTYKSALPGDMSGLGKVMQNSIVNLKTYKNIYEAYTKNEPIYITNKNSKNYDSSINDFFVRYNLKQSFTIPVSKKNFPPIGVINFMTVGSTFTNDDMIKAQKLVELFYCPFSSTLKMEKMIEAQKEVENAKNRYQRLLALSAQINLLVDPNELFQLLIKEMLEIFGYQLGFIQLEKENRLPFVNGYAIGENNQQVLKELNEYFRVLENAFKIQPLWNEESGACCIAFANNTHFYFEDTKSLEGLAMTEKDKIAMSKCKSPLKSFIQMPIREQNKPIGILQLWGFEDHVQLLESDINMIGSLCSFIPSVLKNADLHKEVENQRMELADLNKTIEAEKAKSDKLLLNILPDEVAEELKNRGKVSPVYYNSASVMFTDFQGFTQISETMTPQELVSELDNYFSVFDMVTEKYGIEKLKTIGDSYMCAGGIPVGNNTHPIDIVLAALEIQELMKQMKLNKEALGQEHWELRLGIHTGPLVAGVIGEKKFVYDIWGDTVNTASRMESSGENGKINISEATKELVEDLFMLEFRGGVQAKNKGIVDMYFVNGIRPRLSKNGDCKTPNEKFYEVYEALKEQKPVSAISSQNLAAQEKLLRR